MRECCVCEKQIQAHTDFFKIKQPSGLKKFICVPCKQLLRIGFEAEGKMKFTKGRLAGSRSVDK